MRVGTVRREQEEWKHEYEVPERRKKGPIRRSPSRVAGVERDERRKPEQRLAVIRSRRRSRPATNDETDQAPDIAGGPADAGQVPSRFVGDKRWHHGVVEDRGKLRPDDGEPVGDEHERSEIGAPGDGKHEPAKAKHE